MTVDRQHAPQVRDRKSAPKAPRVNLGPTSMERAARVAAAGIVPVRIPSVPPTDPDADILNAYATTLHLRAAGYASEDAEFLAGEVSVDAADAENVVWNREPKTVGGVVARLSMMVPEIDDARWVDQLQSQHGLLSLIARRDELDIDARHIAAAAEFLVRIDWQQALAAYEAEEHALHTLNSLLEVIEAEAERAGGIEGFRRVEFAGDEAYAALRSDCPALARLIRTLAPDGEAFRIKMQIATSEDAAHHIPGTAEYLDRDFMHVMGRYAAAAQAEG